MTFLRRIKAFSLLEVLIALALGCVVIAAILYAYLGVRSVYQTTQDNARLQENIRFASYFLTEKISMAGYAGCGNLAYVDLNSYPVYEFSPQNSLKGYSKEDIPFDLQRYNIVDNTDVIVIQKADENITNLTDKIVKKGGETSLYVGTHPATKMNDPLLIANCANADLFPSDNYQGNVIKTSWTKLRRNYDIANTQVSRYTEIAYFISATTNPNESPRYGLYYAINGGDKEMIIDGVDNMKIKYGVDEMGSGKISVYYTTQEMEQRKIWDEVLSVVITLSLVRSGQASSKVSKAQEWDIYIKLRERG